MLDTRFEFLMCFFIDGQSIEGFFSRPDTAFLKGIGEGPRLDSSAFLQLRRYEAAHRVRLFLDRLGVIEPTSCVDLEVLVNGHGN